MSKAEKVESVRAWRKRQRKARREARMREWRCFWTWPLGHHYRSYECVNCGHRMAIM